MYIELQTAPTLYPVTLAEIKTHLRIDAGTIDDEVSESTALDSIRLAAIAHIEVITRRKLLTQTWDYYLDEWPDVDFIRIPFGRLQSVTSVSWKDTDGTETTLTANTDYLVETNGDAIGRLVLPHGESWPSDSLYPSKPIKIRFVCGWTAAASVPDCITNAIKLAAENIYYRGEVVKELDAAIMSLVADYRLHEFF